MKSTATKYGTVAVTLHWLSALFIFALMGSGFRAGSLVESTAKASVLSAHVPLGIIILLLTLARVAWWLFADRKPNHPAGDPGWQIMSAKIVHVLFYIVIFGMVASGIGMMVLSGAGTILFAGSAEPLPDFWDYLPRVPHGIGARVMILLLVLHIGAALYHHFIRKDGLIWRIWFGQKNQQERPK
ncbi:MAG: cytochrome b/b6 domain-containing protein [Sneathiella sp.]|uniref:cytochrome b n=1 Tax=Sneathiella sp. TaxID=1964365 RepID=UPI0030027050